MVNVSANFHTLSIQDAPTTRVRIYFIGPTVDCTDDNDVTTNGTLLVWAAGDTDSNKRIGQDGIKFTEYFNPEVNIQIGDAVSSQIEMTLINTDGALDNFQYGRCKVYLDVYDSVNSAWLSCPMGVYIIELPNKRRSQMVRAFGYDQMQKLDGICDSWWSGLNWSGGLTLLQIVQSMASQLGISVSANTASNILNSSVTYTEAPFDCVEVTYREVLETIAEATCTIARFDRNGALLLRWFEMPQINNQSILIDTDTVGNQCLNIDVSEYTVSNIDSLLVKLAKSDIGVVVGSGTNQYVILGNLLLGGDAATITARATPIYNRLSDWVDPDNSGATYSPVSARLIWDWSIEAGDSIKIKNGGQTRILPVFQQTMTWRGGYVISDLMNSGDPVRPVSDATDRDYYRLDSNMRSLTINADQINLLGYTTINNGFKVNLDGTFEANGAIINGTVVSTDTQNGISVSIDTGRITVIDNNTTVAEIGSDGQGGSEVQLRNSVDSSLTMFDSSELFIRDGNGRRRVSISNTINGSYALIKALDSNGYDVFSVDDTTTTVSNNLSTNDVAVNGVLDLVQRRCSERLSSAGWYRVMTVDAQGAGAASWVCDLTITRVYNATNNEIHRIKLLGVYGSFSFEDEESKTNTTGIDKIRYTQDGTTGYIDIHYSLSAGNDVSVEFDVKCVAQGRFTANALESVADAPSGETVVATYTFTTNETGVGGCDTSTLITSGTLANTAEKTYTATQPCWFYLTYVLQAGSSGGLRVSLNSVDIINYASGEALPVQVSLLPIPLQTGDTLYIKTTSNRTSSYKVFRMR